MWTPTTTSVSADDYLAGYVRLAKPGSPVGIVVPGRTVDLDDVDDDTFRSPAWWADHWRASGVVDGVHADNVERGRELWMRFVESGLAWDGHGTIEDQPDGPLLLAETGRNLSFTRVIATAK